MQTLDKLGNLGNSVTQKVFMYVAILLFYLSLLFCGVHKNLVFPW